MGLISHNVMQIKIEMSWSFLQRHDFFKNFKYRRSLS